MIEFNLYLSPVELTTAVGPIPCLASRLAPSWGTFASHEHFDSPVRWRALELVGAEPSVHAEIQSDTTIVRIFPAASVTLAQIRANYDTPLTTLYSGAGLTALRAELEAVGFDTEWATAATTTRELLRRLVHHWSTHQVAFGDGSAAMSVLHAMDLGDTMTSLSALQRTQARAWMAGKGLDVGWITTGTPVRAVLRYITEHLPSRGLKIMGLES